MRIDAEDLMEDRKIRTKDPRENKNNNGGIIAVVIAIIIVAMLIGVAIVVMQITRPIDTTLKVYIDGAEAQIDSSNFLIEEDKFYVKVKGIASYVGYEAHSGEYKIEAEDANKVFVENKQETASMFLGSNIISKVTPNPSKEYENYEMSAPAKDVDGEIYVISDGFGIACNVGISYDRNENIINIQTLPYIYEKYNEVLQQNGFKEVSDEFNNQKAILYDRVVVENSDGRYGVINSNGEEVIGTRYAHIEFDEYTQEFIITNLNDKMGISDIKGETKIDINYEEIKSINKEKGLYLIKSNNRYGVIDNNKKIVIHADYDEIGVEIEPYSTNIVKSNEREDNENIKKEENVKKYIFFDSIIPVKQNELWSFYDLRGNKLADFKYTGIGCKAKETNKNNKQETQIEAYQKTTNNLLLLEEYELIVVEQNGKYGIIDKKAKEVMAPVATDMYFIRNEGTNSYYMLYNGNTVNLETEIFEPLGIKKKNEEKNGSIISNIIN